MVSELAYSLEFRESLGSVSMSIQNKSSIEDCVCAKTEYSLVCLCVSIRERTWMYCESVELRGCVCVL